MSRRSSSDDIKPPVGIAEEREVGDADDLRRRRLLDAPQVGELGRPDAAVPSTGLAVGDDAVRDLDPGIGPARDAARGAEVDVVGVRGDHQDPLDAVVLHARATLPHYDPGAMLPVTTSTIRLFLHVLAATVWVGGQLTLAGLVPGLRELSPDAPRSVARRFSLIAWPAFAVLVATGIWNIVAIDQTGTRATAPRWSSRSSWSRRPASPRSCTPARGRVADLPSSAR